jgi:chaperonin cofactor prefoldin
MSAVESYDITGKHPEKAELEAELAGVKKALSEAEGALKAENEIKVPIGAASRRGYKGEAEELQRRISTLSTQKDELERKLFEIDPGHDR